jgi:hypothetical protein
VKSSCEFGIEPLGSIKCWDVLISGELSSSTQLHSQLSSDFV